MQQTAIRVSGPLDEERIHGVLRNERRRQTLELLEKHGELSVRELSERIAARESGEDPPPRDARQSVYVSLKQTHLDRLADDGVVEFDGGVVRLGERADEVFAYMGPLRRFTLSWSEYYAALGILGFVTVVAADLGVPMMARFDDGTIALAFLALIVLSAAYQLAAEEGHRVSA